MLTTYPGAELLTPELSISKVLPDLPVGWLEQLLFWKYDESFQTYRIWEGVLSLLKGIPTPIFICFVFHFTSREAIRQDKTREHKRCWPLYLMDEVNGFMIQIIKNNLIVTQLTSLQLADKQLTPAQSIQWIKFLSLTLEWSCWVLPQ